MFNQSHSDEEKMTYLKQFAFMLLFVFSASQLHAGEFGTAEEAMALVNRAIAHVHDVGQDKAFADFNDSKGQFVDRDLYLTIYSLDGMRLAHGQNAKMIGKNVSDATDVNGKVYDPDIIKTGNEGEGWVEYSFSDPVTKKMLPNRIYLKRDGNLIYASGIYVR
jgi:signal transduction histidine kinase